MLNPLPTDRYLPLRVKEEPRQFFSSISNNTVIPTIPSIASPTHSNNNTPASWTSSLSIRSSFRSELSTFSPLSAASFESHSLTDEGEQDIFDMFNMPPENIKNEQYDSSASAPIPNDFLFETPSFGISTSSSSFPNYNSRIVSQLNNDLNTLQPPQNSSTPTFSIFSNNNTWSPAAVPQSNNYAINNNTKYTQNNFQRQHISPRHTPIQEDDNMQMREEDISHPPTRLCSLSSALDLVPTTVPFSTSSTISPAPSHLASPTPVEFSWPAVSPLPIVPSVHGRQSNRQIQHQSQRQSHSQPDTNEFDLGYSSNSAPQANNIMQSARMQEQSLFSNQQSMRNHPQQHIPQQYQQQKQQYQSHDSSRVKVERSYPTTLPRYGSTGAIRTQGQSSATHSQSYSNTNSYRQSQLIHQGIEAFAPAITTSTSSSSSSSNSSYHASSPFPASTPAWAVPVEHPVPAQHYVTRMNTTPPASPSHAYATSASYNKVTKRSSRSHSSSSNSNTTTRKAPVRIRHRPPYVCTPCPLLTHISPHPIRIFSLAVQQQFTVTRKAASSLSPSDKCRLVDVNLRIVGLSPAEFYVVAKDICVLMHIRKGNVAKSIGQFPEVEKARVQVECSRGHKTTTQSSNRAGGVSLHVLTVLTPAGVRRLVEKRNTRLARTVLQWIEVEISRLTRGENTSSDEKIVFDIATGGGGSDGSDDDDDEEEDE